MSQNYAAAELQIRRLIGDLDYGNLIFDTYFDIYGLLTPTMLQMASKAGHNGTWVLNAFSSTAGSFADVALPGFHNAMIQDIRDTANGRPIAKLSLEEIEAWRFGLTSSSAPGSGDPVAYTLYEDESQVCYLRFNCVPQRVIAYDIHRSLIPTVGYLDTTTMPLSDEFNRAVEMAVALRLVKRATPEQRARINVSDDILAEWKDAEQAGIQLEKVRLQRIKGRPYGVGAILGR